jgi:diguanylate cyclase (GGDEF)-like protein
VSITLVFLLLAVVRHQTRPPQLPGPAQRRWLHRYLAIILGSVIIWVVTQVWIILDASIAPLAKSVSLFGTVALCSVLAHLYASSLRLTVAGILLLVVPTTVALWMVPGLHLLAVALTFYAGYLGTAVMQSRRDYRRRLELAEALLEQRDRYEQLSWTDELTGLCNRRRFAETLNAQVRQMVAASGPIVTLMLMDIDHFKTINDRYGHIIGDEALRRFAERLRGEFGEPGMLVARTGGEEFALIATGMSEEVAMFRADAFRLAMAADALQIAGLQVPLTVSIGVGSFDLPLHRNDDGLYGAVDVALYAAKQQGRNRVVSVGLLDSAGQDVQAPLNVQSSMVPMTQETAGHA